MAQCFVSTSISKAEQGLFLCVGVSYTQISARSQFGESRSFLKIFVTVPLQLPPFSSNTLPCPAHHSHVPSSTLLSLSLGPFIRVPWLLLEKVNSEASFDFVFVLFWLYVCVGCDIVLTLLSWFGLPLLFPRSLKGRSGKATLLSLAQGRWPLASRLFYVIVFTDLVNEGSPQPFLMRGPTTWSGHCSSPKPPCPSSPTEPTLMCRMSRSFLRPLTNMTKQIKERRLGIGALFLAHFLRATEGRPKRLVFRPWEVAPCSRYFLPYSSPDLPTSPTPSFPQPNYKQVSPGQCSNSVLQKIPPSTL